MFANKRFSIAAVVDHPSQNCTSPFVPLCACEGGFTVRNMAPGSLEKRNSLDEHGFPLQINADSDSRTFIPKPAYMCMQEQEEFDDISWDDGTITTRGTMSFPSVPRIMPVQKSSLHEEDNPFGYECGGQKSPSNETTSRPNRRASLSTTDCHSRQEHRARQSRRRSSLSHQPVCYEEALPTFAGEGILSTTTIDQGNGQRVCVVVIKLDDTEEGAARKPQGDETNHKTSERKDPNRKLDRKSSELRSTDRKSSERRELDRKSSERNSSGHTRRRPSANKAVGTSQSSEDKENRTESHRLRRYSSGVDDKNGTTDGTEPVSDRPQRRRSIVSRASSSDEKESGRDSNRHRSRSSLSSSADDKTSSTNGAEPSSDRPRRRRSSVGRAATDSNHKEKGSCRDSDRQRRRSSISSGVDDKNDSTISDRPQRRRSCVGRDSRDEKQGSGRDSDRQHRRSSTSSGVADKNNSTDTKESISDRTRRRRSSVGRTGNSDGKESRRDSDREHRRSSKGSSAANVDSEISHESEVSNTETRRSTEEPVESGRSRNQDEKKQRKCRKSQSSTDD